MLGLIVEPLHTTIYDARNSAPVPASIARLTAETAEEYVDVAWWGNVRDDADEDDRRWDWSGCIAKNRRGARSKSFGFYALRTKDHAVQAALIYQTGFQSPNHSSVIFLKALASAPRNRRRLCGEMQQFSGCGTRLVAYAAAVGYTMKTSGGLICFPLEKSIPFYEKLGFVRGDTQDDNGLFLYELAPENSLALAVNNGFIKHGE
jgi:GNAT superfamily N-acetyltransferase